jgi:hypothetical protein
VILRSDRGAHRALVAALAAYEAKHGPLPGLGDDGTRASLLEQIVESRRRKAYLARVRDSDLQDVSADPRSELFDPMRAAVLQHRRGDLDEAFWMLFLFTHFGRHRTSRWAYARVVYAGAGQAWTWDRLTEDITGFRDWLEGAQAGIRPQGGFGNHRKREHLSGWGANGTGAVVASYVEWTGEPPVHSNRFPSGTPRPFGDLYESMAPILRFGRLARFDYLTTGMHLGLIDTEVDGLYLAGSSGPRDGAKRLFGAGPVARLEAASAALAAALGVNGDVMEDALCNWQKSPAAFRSFRG